MSFRQLRDELRAQAGEGVGRQDQSTVWFAREILQGCFDLGGSANRGGNRLHSVRWRSGLDRPHEEFGLGDVSGLNITATRERLGAISLSRSTHFPPTENSYMLKPVRLPPGLLTLATKPCSTGSETCTNTTGTVLVAC